MSKKIWAVIALIILLAAGWAVYRHIRDQQPDHMIFSMLKNFYTVKTFHYGLNLSLQGEVKAQPLKINIRAQGDMDKANFEYPKSITQAFTIVETPTGVLSLESEIRAFREVCFVRMASMPKGLEALNAFKAVWLKFPLAEFKQKYHVDDTRLKPQALAKLVHDTKFISKYEERPDETIDNVPCRHFVVTLDPVACSNFLHKLYNLSNTQPDPDAELKLKNVMTRFDVLKADLWIGKSDRYLYKAKSLLVFSPDNSGNKVILPLEATFSKYRQTLAIDEPKDAQEAPYLLNFLSELFNK